MCHGTKHEKKERKRRRVGGTVAAVHVSRAVVPHASNTN